MIQFKRCVVVLAVVVAAVVMGGCERQGPAEDAGERLDEATEQSRERAGEAVEDAQGSQQNQK
jgi:uncharacterized membrane protein